MSRATLLLNDQMPVFFQEAVAQSIPAKSLARTSALPSITASITAGLPDFRAAFTTSLTSSALSSR